MKQDVIEMMGHRRMVVADARILQEHIDTAFDLFTRYALSLNPDISGLFDHDRDRMKSAFAAMLRVFASLKFMDDQAYEHQRLAQRHHHYGVDYAMVKAFNQALVLTLRKQCGEAFDKQHLTAWRTTLEFFAEQFKRELAPRRQSPAADEARKAG
jgi:hemoglobin-like flavoprotein